MTHHIDLSTLTLAKGGHDDRSDGTCLLEAVAYFAGEPHSDRPKCTSPVLTTCGINLNDVLPDDKRQQLVPFVPRMVGTRGDGLDETRSYLALDWLIRTYTPTWLDLAGLTVEAQALRDLRRIVDLVSAQAAGPVVRAGAEKARAARAAAGDAAWNAAGAAAWAAAWDALAPTIAALQDSAITLLDTMIAPAVTA